MKKFYERYWDDREVMGDLDIKWNSIKQQIPLGQNINFLDFGCGKGILLSKVITVNPKLVISGTDVSKNAIRYIKKKIPKGKFYAIQEGKKLPFKDASFDFILASDVLEHVYDTELIFLELARILKPGKKMFISVPYHGAFKNILITLVGFDFYFNPKQPHIRFYTKNNLFRCIKEVGLTITKYGYYGRFYPISHGIYVVCEKLKSSG